MIYRITMNDARDAGSEEDKVSGKSITMRSGSARLLFNF